VRQDLYNELVKVNPDKDWSFVLQQIGMFTFTGMTPAQCDNMTNKHHVYMTRDGRISLAGLSSAKCEHLARAIDDSVRNY
jgi:aspartate aminotransferase